MLPSAPSTKEQLCHSLSLASQLGNLLDLRSELVAQLLIHLPVTKGGS